MWFVYVVRCSDRSLYTGGTTDAKRRVAEHNDGRGARYTRSRGPVALVYLEPAEDRGAALKREHEIKRMTAAEKLVLVNASRRARLSGRKTARARTRARRLTSSRRS